MNSFYSQVHNAIIPEELDEDSKNRISAVSLPGGSNIQNTKTVVTQLNHRERAHLD